MDVLTQSQLPVLNFDNLKPGTESWMLACHKVRRTLEQYGCFMVVSNEFSQQFKDEVFDSLKPLFELPIETKMKNSSDKPYHGYLGPFRTRPLYESMGIEHATSMDDIERFSNIIWPSGNDQFIKTMHSYANLVSKLENTVRKMVFESYGVEKYHESFNESMTYLLKLIKYRQPKSNETNMGAMTHTDKDFLTILCQNQVNGLEVQIKDGEWISVEYLPSSFVVIVADAFMAWSNGRLKPALHRVVMKGKEERYSTTLFTFKRGIIEIPEELVDGEHPPRFKPFDHFKFLDFQAKNPIYLDERAIILFCGI